MYCPRCGFENRYNSQFCEKCGEPLNVNSGINGFYNGSQYDNSQKSNNKWIIIAITLIVIAVIVAGTLIYISGNNNNNDASENAVSNKNIQDNVNTESAVNTQSATTKSATTDTPLKIISGSFNTGSSLSDKTYITVYVGKEHAGENVKIKVLYTRDGSQLNPGNIVAKTVDSSGYFTMRSANAFKYYPDHAYVTLYDGSGNVVDTRDITMNPTSGTQTF